MRVTSISTFIEKIENMVYDHIKKSDRYRLPIESYLTFSIRSFIHYYSESDNEKSSVDFIEKTFLDLSEE